MHRLPASTLLVLAPLAASAQQAPATLAPRGITRDQFIERASQMAGRRFDEIDTNHTGVITRDQLRAWRQAHGGQRAGAAATTE